MSNRTLGVVAVFALVSLLGVFIVQIFWFKRAFDMHEKQFNQTTGVALQNVGETILKYNKQTIPLSPLVNQLSANYFTVQINGKIDTRTLELLLKNEFGKRHLKLDFEYGIYNCESGKMVYGNYVAADTTKDISTLARQLPVGPKDSYYFAVRFPTKEINLLSQMGIWLFSTFVFLLVLGFFSYTLFVIFRQKQLSEIQKDFINNMTHEFKTPLSTIIVSTELLKNPNVYQSPEHILNYVTIIRQEAKRIQHQVERVLQIAAIDRGSVQFRFEEIDLHQAIQQAINSIEVLMQQKSGTFDLQFHANSSLLLADGLHLTNMIFNLLDNALKYTAPDDKPHIIIRTENNNHYLTLYIKDNGIGIPSEHQKKVFDQFYRVPKGNIHDVKGFGLGLYYVKTVVSAHKAKITVKSKEGEGSEFCIQFPK